MVINHLHDTEVKGLRYVNLDLSTFRLVLFTDVSSANAKDLKTQLGFVLLMVKSDNDGKVIEFGFSSCRRATGSVLASEQHSFVIVFDIAYVIRHLLVRILARKWRI